VWAFLSWLFMCVSTIFSNLPSIAFGFHSLFLLWFFLREPLFPTCLTLPLSAQPLPGHLKKVKSKTKFLFILHPTHILPSFSLGGNFCYEYSCGWAHFLRIHLALRLGDVPSFCYDSSRGIPFLQFTLPYLWAPKLDQAILKKLIRNQNFSLSEIWIVFLTSALILIMALHVGGCTSC